MIFKNIFSINSSGEACIEFRLKWGGISDFKNIKRGGYYLNFQFKCIKQLRDFLFQNKTFIPEYNPT